MIRQRTAKYGSKEFIRYYDQDSCIKNFILEQAVLPITTQCLVETLAYRLGLKITENAMRKRCNKLVRQGLLVKTKESNRCIWVSKDMFKFYQEVKSEFDVFEGMF
jgi:hypothetical protein